MLSKLTKKIFESIYMESDSLRFNPAVIRTLKFGVSLLGDIETSEETPNGLIYELELIDRLNNLYASYCWWTGRSAGLVIVDTSNLAA